MCINLKKLTVGILIIWCIPFGNFNINDEISRLMRNGDLTAQGKIIIDDVDISERWTEIVRDGLVYPLEIKDGRVSWKTTNRNGQEVSVEEKDVGPYRIFFNEWRKHWPDVSKGNIGEHANNCRFCQLATEPQEDELAIIEVADGRQWKVLSNPNPFEKEGDLVLIPVAEKRPQFITKEDVIDVLEIVTKSQNLFLFFNQVGAGAWYNHVHFRGIYDRGQLSLYNIDTEVIETIRDTSIYRLLHYPAKGYLIEGDDCSSIAEVAFDFIKGAQEKSIPFNLVVLKNKIFIFLRKAEVVSYFDTIKLGAMEMGGYFIVEDKGLFKNITIRDIEESLDIATRE